MGFGSFKALVPVNEMAWDYIDIGREYLLQGDTDSSYILIDDFVKDLSIDKQCEFSDTLAEHVQSTFPSLLIDCCNVPQDRLDIIRTDREVVADRTIVYAKKKYIMRCVDVEGVRKVYIKKMGVEIKKTDTPEYVKDFLEELVMATLEGKSVSTLKRMKKEFEQDYFTQPADVIGVPTTVRSITKAEEKMRENIEAGLPKWKHISRNAKGAIYYNSLCGTEHDKILNGSKVYMVYTMDGIKTMSIPKDANNIPDCVKNIDIDYQKMWSKVSDVIDRYILPLESNSKKSFEDMLTFL